MVGWTVIRDAGDARVFAAALAAAPRSFVGRTAIGSAIDFAFGQFASAGFAADLRIIDVSGDGTSIQGRPVTAARDAASRPARSSTGSRSSTAAPPRWAAICTDPPGGLEQYYCDNVIGGTGAFVAPIDDFRSFGDAIARKLVNEIAGG